MPPPARVFVVEDEALVAMDLSEVLERLGFDVLGVAHEATEAERLIRERRPDVVLLDVNLGDGSDGVEVARRIRAQDGPAVVYLTAYSDSETLARARATAPHGYIVKPFDERDLAITLDFAVHRHRSERELDRARIRHLQLLEGITDGVYGVDGEGRVTYANSAAAAILGWTPEQVSGRLIHAVLHGRGHGPGSCPVLAVLRSGLAMSRVEEPVRRRDGIEVPLEYSVSPHREEGVITGATVLFRDRTDFHLAQRALQLEESERLFRTLADHAPMMIWMADAEGDVGFFARPWLTFTGRPLEEELGDGWLAGVHPDDRAAVAAVGREHFGAGTPFTREYRLRDARGRWRWVLDQGLPLREGREVRSFVGSAVDITERKETEERLRAQSAELARINEELEQYAYVASHQLQEPLRMVSAYTSLLSARYGDRLDDEAHSYIDFAVQGAQRMSDLVQALLAYARLRQLSPDRGPADAESALATVLDDLAPALGEAGATVTHDPLPRVRVAETHLREILRNLVSNAVKFHGEEPPRVHVGASRQGPFWELGVTDNGIGIPAGSEKEIFQIFHRLHAQDEYPGTGIGLSLCKRLVENAGGQVRVRSEPGRGSTFYFTLPAVD